MADHSPQASALRSSHDRLRSIVESLGPDEVTGPSYDDDWTIAQVLSHLGSGAEIFAGIVRAALAGAHEVSTDGFPAVWERWNAMDPQEQTRSWAAAEQAFLDLIEQAPDEQADAVALSLFGMDLDLAGLLGLRLSEHTLHTWDVEVVTRPTAQLAPESVALLGDLPLRLSGRAGRPDGRERTVLVGTEDPERAYRLRTGDAVSVERIDDSRVDEGDPSLPGGAAASLHLPAEAWLRLVAGRLDPDHTPAGIRAEGVDLDDLRPLFPGF